MAFAENDSKPDDQWPLMLAAIGIVFGDIGTSPLYTMKECMFHSTHAPFSVAVLGSLSLIFWSLIFLVGIKYVSFITRADNQGEGGIFALLALSQANEKPSRKIGLLTVAILAGAALLYGDGVITPAISVLSAAEGLHYISDDFRGWSVPIACVILFGLFWVQHKGTHHIGRIFGPVMMIWFGTLAFLGVWQVIQYPAVLAALNPLAGISLLSINPAVAAGILGAVVLSITGAEALYADMGHLGRRAIARSWYFIALPSLFLNYFGQGAYLLHMGKPEANPFFSLAPAGGCQLALVVLSLVATVIASQALISGTFSLSRQAVHLGYFPRLGVIHTSNDYEGQIYIPSLNWMLAAICLAIVVHFGSSDRLASAYGLAVTGTMAITTIAFFDVILKKWKWPLSKALPLCLLFFLVDITFFTANLTKFEDGGWLPLLLGAIVLTIMYTWKTGREEVAAQIQEQSIDTDIVVQDVTNNQIVRVPGTAVFMSANPEGTPIALLHHMKANRCLHKQVILLTCLVEPVPRVDAANHLELTELGGGIWRAVARYGYMESPNAPILAGLLKARGININPLSTTYYFNRETIILGGKSRMWGWQKQLYRFLASNARAAREYFGIPPNQIIEMGLPVQL